MDVDASLHRAARNSRGQVPGKFDASKQVLIVRASSIGDYLRKILSHVGWAKWGWGVASLALGAKTGKDGAPGWVTRHAPGGSIVTKLTGLSQHIKLTNNRAVGRDPQGAANFCAEYDKLSVIKELKARMDSTVKGH